MIIYYEVLHTIGESDYHVDFKNKKIVKNMVLKIRNPYNLEESIVDWELSKEDVEIVRRYGKVKR